MSEVITICNQKGGVGKTTTTVNLGIGLAAAGKRVLLIDGDPQGSLTIALGYTRPDMLKPTLADHLQARIEDTAFPEPREGLLRHIEGVDLMPSNIGLASLELPLMMAMDRERVLKGYIESLKQDYDYILIDCMPSLGLLTINSLAAAEGVIVPVQAQYLPARGLEQLLHTIARIRRQINPRLKVGGILITMAGRTSLARVSIEAIQAAYGDSLRLFDARIPLSTKVGEAALAGTSIYNHDPYGKAAEAYRDLVKEVLAVE